MLIIRGEAAHFVHIKKCRVVKNKTYSRHKIFGRREEGGEEAVAVGRWT
jgi:hypothetical protein